MMFFSHGRLYEDELRVHQYSPDQTSANSLIIIGTFMSALFYFRMAIEDERATANSLTTKTCLACGSLLILNIYRVFHPRRLIVLSPLKSIQILLTYIAEVFLLLFLTFLHHISISRFAFLATLDSRDRIIWSLTSLVFFQVMPFRTAILWPLPLSWNSKTVSCHPLRRSLFHLCRIAFWLSVGIAILGWSFFILAPNSILIRILSLPPDLRRHSMLPTVNDSMNRNNVSERYCPIFFIYRLGVVLITLMDRRYVHLSSFRVRQGLKSVRKKLEIKRTRKVGLVRKFIHVARSGVTILRFYVDALCRATIQNKELIPVLDSLRCSNRFYWSVVDRLSDEFESDFIHRSDSIVVMSTPTNRIEEPLPLEEPPLELPELHLILAEDDSVIQTILFKILQPHCKSIVIVNNGLELVRTIVREKPNIFTSPDYCIITDINMPIVDGKSAVAMIRTLPFAADLPIIALTGTAITEENWVEKYGFDEVIQKPFDILTLYREICDVWKSKWKNRSIEQRSGLQPPPLPEDNLSQAPIITRQSIVEISQDALEGEFRKKRLKVNVLFTTIAYLPMIFVLCVSSDRVVLWPLFLLSLGHLNGVLHVLPLSAGFTSNLMGFMLYSSLVLENDGMMTLALFFIGVYAAFLRISDHFDGWHSDAAAAMAVVITLYYTFNYAASRDSSGCVLSVAISGGLCFGTALRSSMFGSIDEEERISIVKCNREIEIATRVVFEITACVTLHLGDHFEDFSWALDVLSKHRRLTESCDFAVKTLRQTHRKITRASRSLTKYCEMDKGKIQLFQNYTMPLRDFVVGLTENILTDVDDHEARWLLDCQISESVVVLVDLDCVLSILLTLLLNATTHGTSERGVVVQTSATSSETGEFYLFEFTVRDYGCGMTEEEIKLALRDPFSVDVEIFDPTLNRGISLYLCSVFAGLMSGSIELSPPKDGDEGLVATFKCQLRASSNDSLRQEGQEDLVPATTATILIIDDCLAIRRAIVHYLTEQGVLASNIIEISSHDEVVGFVAKSLINFEFIFTFLDDHLSSNSSGLAFVKLAKREGWLFRLGVVCFLSGIVGVELRSVEEDEELRGTEFCSLTKPICVHELREVIRGRVILNHDIDK